MRYIPKHSQRLHSISSLPSPKTGKILAYWIVGIFILAFLCMFLPWQQNIQGQGKVTALSPEDRPQTIESAIAGRIVRWDIEEGQFVNQGDTIVVLEEVKSQYFDPHLLTRLNEQLEAKKQSAKATQDKIGAYQNQLHALQQARELKLETARNKFQQARMKVRIDSAAFETEKVAYDIAQRQFERIKDLYDEGLYSLTKLEKRKNKFQEKAAKLVDKENKLQLSQNELVNAQINLNSIRADYAEKIAKTRTMLNEAESKYAAYRGEIAKLQNKLTNMRIRNEQYVTRAPQDGYIIKAVKSGLGQIIKEGEAICSVMPENPNIAVELYVKAMDVPLLSQGREARLEFDGWPSLQFSGWPSVAVGTFGGFIYSIDYTDTKGKYRVLIAQDPEEPWPDRLRMGSGVFGWIMLEDVPVWYEIWRQLNGFPPSLENAPDAPRGKMDIGSDKNPKAPKVKI